jgi:D-arginine dehydrogenase
MDVSPWPLVNDVGEEFYFKPEAGFILASPADETPSEPCDVQPDELDVATIAWRMEEFTTLPVQRIRRRWAGLRTFTPDRTPFFAFDENAEGFFWLVGQGGYGIQTAPGISARAAALILERLRS